MTATNSTARPRILVAIDIAKAKHEVLVELPTGKRRKMIVRNQLSDFHQLAAYLKRLEGALEIALEPTADYHRNLAYFLKAQGFVVSSSPRLRSPERVRHCTTPGIRTTPKTRRSSCICCVMGIHNTSTIQSSSKPTICRNCRRLTSRFHCLRLVCNTVCSTIIYRFTFLRQSGFFPIAAPVGLPVC